jgi:hypothetical protein
MPRANGTLNFNDEAQILETTRAGPVGDVDKIGSVGPGAIAARTG